METHPVGPDDERRAATVLHALDGDRGRLGELMKAPPWYGPLCGLLVAALLLTPSIQVDWFTPVPVVLGVLAGFGLQHLYRRAVGITKRGLAGWMSALMVILTVGCVLALYCAAWLLTGFGMPFAVAGVAASGFAIMWALVALNDRAVAWDLRHAR